MFINKILFDLLKSDDPIQQINLNNEKNIYNKDGLLNNSFRKKGYGNNESKISDVILHNENNSKWNINFKTIINKNEKRSIFSSLFTFFRI